MFDNAKQDPTYLNATTKQTSTPPYASDGNSGEQAYGYGGGNGQYAAQHQPGGFSYGHGGPRRQLQPGKQSQALKYRLMYLAIHCLLAIATCLTVSIGTRYIPFIVISAGGAAAATFFVPLAAWQSVTGRKHRFVDRIDSEIAYLVSQVFVWGVLGGISIWMTSGRTCTANFWARGVRPPIDDATLCNILRASIGLSFAHVGFLIGWIIWFVQVVRGAGHDDKGRTWRASTSKLLREWH